MCNVFDSHTLRLSIQEPPPPTSSVLDRLQCVVLNGCKTDAIGRHLLTITDSICVVCWSTLAEDNAARAFALGFYEAVNRMLLQERQASGNWRSWARVRGRGRGLLIEAAFTAGCESFLKQGFKFGDPEDWIHPAGHPHHYRPDFADCQCCSPPVHGECLFLRVVKGRVVTKRASEALFHYY